MKTIYKSLFLLSILLVIASIIILFLFGFNFGVEFIGGSLLDVSFIESSPSQEELSSHLESLDYISSFSVQLSEGDSALLRFAEITETEHQLLLTSLSEKFGNIEERSFNSIGSVIGNELRRKGITALIVVFLAIVIYIAFAFRKLSSVLSPWVLGVAALIALFHDVLITAGVFSLLGHFGGVEISAVFLAAALTILGYSVADSVVVFDRIRENVLKFGRDRFGDLIHRSVLETLRRSVYTSLTTVIPLLAIYFFGGQSIKFFSLALIIGILSGTYSSIIIATPLVYWMSRGR